MRAANKLRGVRGEMGASRLRLAASTALIATGALAAGSACSSREASSPARASGGSNVDDASESADVTGARSANEGNAESDSGGTQDDASEGADGGLVGHGSEGGGLPSAPATGADGGVCPSLTGPADKAYPRWPMPNPPAANLPNPFDYTDNGNGTVADNVTGLVWQKEVSGSGSFADAPAYCSSLALPAPAGRTWSVPTRIQLLSIVDYTTAAAVDAPFLASGQPPGGMYTWTSTPWVVSQISTKPQDAWMVNFGGGGGLTSNAAAQTAAEWIRCVAAPAVTPLPYPHYVQVDDGEVGDVETGLVWAQTSNNTLMTQAAAVSYCASLGLNGHTWRLPSVNELASLVDDNPNIEQVSPAIDQCVFYDTSPSTYYISSSTWGTTPWGLNYEDGFDFNTQPQLPGPTGMPEGYVKCVR